MSERLAILISNKGTGSNLQAIIDAINRKEIHCVIPLVVSDKKDAQGLERAKKYDIDYEVRELEDRQNPQARAIYGKEMADLLNNHDVNIAILAGFGTVLSPDYFEGFKGLTLNVHPGLIPDKEDGAFYNTSSYI